MSDFDILPTEVSKLLAGHAEHRRRLARLSFEEKIAIIERMRVLNSWRQQHKNPTSLNPLATPKTGSFNSLTAILHFGLTKSSRFCVIKTSCFSFDKIVTCLSEL